MAALTQVRVPPIYAVYSAIADFTNAAHCRWLMVMSNNKEQHTAAHNTLGIKFHAASFHSRFIFWLNWDMAHSPSAPLILVAHLWCVLTGRGWRVSRCSWRVSSTWAVEQTKAINFSVLSRRKKSIIQIKTHLYCGELGL